MIFSGNGSDRRRSKEQKKELKAGLKELRRQLTAAGVEKGAAAEYIKELQETLERRESLRSGYEEARGHLKRARESIARLSDWMGESPANEVAASLQELVAELKGVYHDCLIREDDTDFGATAAGIAQMAAQYGADSSGMQAIMLRSELENAKAVMDDVAGFAAPDFFALAYYLGHEERGTLSEMENGQRNQFVSDYTKEHFLNAFLRECRKAGAEPRVWEMIHHGM